MKNNIVLILFVLFIYKIYTQKNIYTFVNEFENLIK